MGWGSFSLDNHGAPLGVVMHWAAHLELLFDLHQQLLTPGAVLGLAGLSQVRAQRRDLARAEARAAALELVHLRSGVRDVKW